MMQDAPLIRVENLSRRFHVGDDIANVLSAITLSIFAGQFVAIMGPSGSGKSTFLNVLGLLDSPTSGQYWLEGEEVSNSNPERLATLRCRKIGFVFQEFNLLQRLDALKNVELPMIYAGVGRRDRRNRALSALCQVGLAARINHLPSQLSGGQQQRVALARALINAPRVLLADEPTGSLDSRTSIELMALLQMLNRGGVTIILVTHDPAVAKHAHRVVHFMDGRVISDISQDPIDAISQKSSPVTDQNYVAS